MIRVKMTRDQMLDYLEQFEDKRYAVRKGDDVEDVKAEVKATLDKMVQLLRMFGFEYYSSFEAIQQRLNNSYSWDRDKENTSWYYRFYLDENKYSWIQVQIGWYYEMSKPYGRRGNKRRYTRALKGICRVDKNGGYELNPSTGHPYQLGDVKYDESGYRSAVLTRRGWDWGD